MALELLDEHEQSELVRAWLRDNIGWILLGLAVGVGAIGGYWKWQQVSKTHTEDAQIEYGVLTDAVDKKDAAAIEAAAITMRTKYEDTPYAALAEMLRAQEALKANDPAKATTSLEWVRQNAKVGEIKTIATLRLAELKLAANDAKGALDLIDTLKDEGFKAQIADARGDALAALNRTDDARRAYDDALGALDAMSPQRQFIEWKRDELPAAAVAAAPVPAPATTPAVTPAPATPAPAETPTPAPAADAKPAQGQS
jgi:predicted negative regulator of RcsB-dependent stress response